MALPLFGWRDRPNTSTPLSAAELEAFGLHIASYIENTSAPVTTQVAAGNLNATYALDFGHQTNRTILLTGTLNTNCTITFTNFAAGCVAYLLVTQDSTGGRTLTISDGIGNSSLLPIAGDVNALSTVLVVCPDATTLDISVLGASGLPNTIAQVEPYAIPYTLYVNNQNGSDTNKGNSPGQAFQTIAKAVQVLHQAAHGGEIVLIGVSGGGYNISAPLSFAVPVFIRAATPSAATLLRTYTTPNSRSVWDAITTVSGSLVTSATASFVAGDVNRIVEIYGAGVGGGTYYDFIASQAGTTATFANGTTTIARNSTTDPVGVKLRVLGDWNRVVTDASITAPGVGVVSVITSATAAFTTADLGTEVMIAGAGQGHQALRGVIKQVNSATQVTITASATFAVSSARCVIGLNLGTMLTWHGTTGGQSGFRYLVLTDQTGNSNAVGSAMDIYAPDMGSGFQSNPADYSFEISTLTSTGASGAWEHMVTCDGSWNQSVSGPGIRRATFVGTKIFGARTPGETFRLISPLHFDFFGNGIVGAAPTILAQGYRILDPQNTAGIQVSSSDVNFSGSEGLAAYFYCEGQYCTYIGGRLSASIPLAGRRVIELAPISDHCTILTVNGSTPGVNSVTNSQADEYDAGTNNVVHTQVTKRTTAKALDASGLPSSPALTYETVSRRSFTNASQVIGSSGVMLMQSIWLPGGLKISRLGLVGGSGALAWGSGWTGPHFIYGLYDPDGNLFGQSADTGGTQVFNNTYANAIINIAKDGAGAAASSVRVPRSGTCWLTLLISSGTGGSAFTYPNFAGFATGLANISPVLCGTVGSGLTALPSPSTTVPPASGLGNLLYGGVG